MLDAPLFAADVWGWIVPIVVIAVYVISHLWNVIQGPQPQQQRPNQQRRPRGPQGERPLPGQPAEPQPPAGQSHLNAEIEQFLKRANERREQKARRGSPPQEVPPAAPQRRPELSAAAKVESSERTDFNSVAASVEQHLGRRSFEQRERNLTEEIDQADEEMELHLQQAFGHRVGTFEGSTSRDSAPLPSEAAQPAPSDNRPATARALAGLLVNQESLRQAVLLKEILERPVDRW